jgi:two-component system nitrogen regulation response regulator NtrX
MASRRKPLVLVVDDESDIRSTLRMILEYEGYELAEASSGEDALHRAASDRPDAVILDIKMPRMDGLEVLARLKQAEPGLPIVVISGHGTIATALEATRLGAFDFMEKPLERDRVLLVLRNALERRRLENENRDHKLTYEERFKLIGTSTAMNAVREAMSLAAPVKASVLITGESGSGKELVARAIHRNSPRAAKAFVKVNCAAIPDELIESELFGHEKGSFTGATRDQLGKFAQADGGTIFLDEIGDMSLRTQSKVLRALQDGEIEPVGAAKSFVVDVRVIAATN